MSFQFPGKPEPTIVPSNRQKYYVDENEPNNAVIECDYVQFSPTHVLFWDDAEPYDRLLIAIPLGSNATVIGDDGRDDES